MTHRTGRIVFGLAVGILVAVYAYRWITDPLPRAERALEESVVLASREVLATATQIDALEIVDPLASNRKVGKVYVYREGDGWAVSGYYRRNDTDRWHPYLMHLNDNFQLAHLKVADATMRPILLDPQTYTVLD